MNHENHIEMRINEWLDSQGVTVVRPETTIDDYFHKIRREIIKKMEIELKEVF